MRSCLAAIALARRLGLSESETSDVFYTALLEHVGCSGAAHEAAGAYGDEMRLFAAAVVTDDTFRDELGTMLPRLLRGRPLADRLRVAGLLVDARQPVRPDVRRLGLRGRPVDGAAAGPSGGCPARRPRRVRGMERQGRLPGPQGRGRSRLVSRHPTRGDRHEVHGHRRRGARGRHRQAARGSACSTRRWPTRSSRTPGPSSRRARRRSPPGHAGRRAHAGRDTYRRRG